MKPAPAQHVRTVSTYLLVVVAVAGSAAAIQFASQSLIVTLAFLGGLAVLGALAFVSWRNPPAAQPATSEILPDWSVAREVMAQGRTALAITDRANRLLCANSAFEEAFGIAEAPPRLKLDDSDPDVLYRLARDAWRDGHGAEPVTFLHADRQWNVTATRAGAADDYCVWRFRPALREDPLAETGTHIAGVFGKVLGAAGIAAALVGPDGAIRAVNPALAQRASGDERARLVGQDFVALLRSDERERIFFAREGRKGNAQTLVHVPLCDPDDGAGLDNAPSLMLLIDNGAGLGGWSSEGRGNAAQLEPLLAQLPLGLATTDREGRFLFANPAFRRAAGLGQSELPPYPSDLVIPTDKTAMSNAVRRFAQGPANAGDIAVRLSKSEGETMTTFGLAGVRGLGEAAVLLSLTDSSHEARYRQEMAQATKMQAVGQLAGGVAHDFNNVLTAIIGYCDLMLLRHTPGDSDYDDIQQIKANSNRAASLTRQLLAFSRQQTLQPTVLQLPDILSEVSQLLKRLLGAKITLKVVHDRDLGPVRADPGQLEQVIINLAVNARDAIQASQGEGASGTLRFATRRVAAKDIRRMGSEIIPAGDYTVLIAEDTGGGIPPDVLGKIFEPFFTTKEQGKGTGLGLSTVYGIVKQSGGFIFASNAKGTDSRVTGARFTIYLPVHDVTAQQHAEAQAEKPARDWSGGGTILLVEDEDTVRAVAERSLTRQGYTVITASDGDEGLEIVAQGEHAFDLVVSDVVMPAMDGPAMAREIRKLRPDLPILFMSGYAEAQLRDQIDIAAMHFIPKPFSVRQIADKVALVMASAKPSRAAGK